MKTSVSLKKIIAISILFIVGITILDYDNIPSHLGLNTSGINWDFYMGILNIISVLVVFIITFVTLNKREMEIHEKEIAREKNKYDISLLFLKNCYEECVNYINILNKQNTEKFIVPKIDFNSANPKIIRNLQNAPFENEGYLMDFVKDGQITKKQIEKYLDIKRNFRQYVNMRITFFDAPDIYEPLKEQLLHLLDTELQSTKFLMQE